VKASKKNLNFCEVSDCGLLFHFSAQGIDQRRDRACR
jgi:hypothetical protein